VHTRTRAQALRLHQEQHVQQTLAVMCRVPCLRHAPLRELTRLAGSARRATYSKGELLRAAAAAHGMTHARMMHKLATAAW
jgi:hypothetical protein